MKYVNYRKLKLDLSEETWHEFYHGEINADNMRSKLNNS